MRRLALWFVNLAVLAGIASGDASAQNHTGRLKSITATKTIKIAYRTDAAPFSFVDQRGEITGYSINLCKMVVALMQAELGVKQLNIQWVRVTSDSRFDAVATGKADLECGASSATLSRMKTVDFSSYIFVENTGLLVNETSDFKRLLNLDGKKIAVVAGTSNEKALTLEIRQGQLKAELVLVADRDAGVVALQDGKADAFASDKMLLVGVQFRFPRTFRLLDADLSTEFYAIVSPRGDWALRLAVNSALARIYRSGEIIKVFNEWFPQVGLRPGFLHGAVYVLGSIPE